MRLRVINLVDSVAPVNFGIWNAAIATAEALQANHEIHSELWYPEMEGFDPTVVKGAKVRTLPDTKIKTLKAILPELNPATDLIVSHGCWRYPTQWGNFLKKKGFHWVYTPHGMLEPWSMAHKAFKKRIYFALIEAPMARRADGIRAVGSPEKVNLGRFFKNVVLIPNGYTAPPSKAPKPEKPLRFLYLSRFHAKKRPFQLAQAWAQGSLANHPAVELVMAGPDEGEVAQIAQIFSSKDVRNAQVSGPVFGQDKSDLLGSSHFFVLPSLSEGFPTSVVEGMGEGLIPLISEGCNFPESFQAGLSIDTGTEPDTILKALETALGMPEAEREFLSNRCRKFSVTNYSIEAVARHLAFWYASILKIQS